MNAETEERDHLLDQATQALRDVPVSDGPNETLVQATLTAVERQSRPSLLGQIASTVRRHRMAACILLPLPVAAMLIAVLFPSLSAARRAAAFGAVIEQLRSAGTVQYRIAYTASGKSAQNQRVMTKGTRQRIEFENGPVVISDLAARRILTLMPDQHKAFLASMPADADSGKDTFSVSFLFARIKDLQTEPGAYRGTREENGQQVVEFETTQKGAQFNILANAQTHEPVRIAIALPLFELTMTMSDFVVDAELSDDLFSLTPPADYEVTEQPDDGTGVIATDAESGQGVVQTTVTMNDADWAAPVEQDVINYLQALADFYEGLFPSAEVFKDPTDSSTAWVRERMQKASEAERQSMAQELARYFLKWHRSAAYFKQVLHVEPNYVGENVAKGDASHPVLTWKLPGQNTVRVIYGDLSLKDVPADGLETQGVQAPASAPAAVGCDLSAPTEQDVVNYIRALAERNHGVFPSTKEMQPLMETANRERQQARSPEEQQHAKEYFILQMRASMYCRTIKSSPVPVSSGVKLGDGTKPVFVWPLPEQKRARVLYGDLKVRELAMDSPEFKAIIAKDAPNLPYATPDNLARKPQSQPAP